jgi:lipopolysaccharide export system ATP-binding protein
MSPESLTLDAVEFGYRGIPLLRGIYLEICRGEVIGLLGSNGSGKTTLMEIAAGQITPASGSVLVNGTRIVRPSRRQRFECIGYLPQESMIPAAMTPVSLAGYLPDTGRAFYTAEIPAEHLSMRVGDLSWGQRRIVEIILVLALGRPYLLMDEPFTGLDPIVCQHVVSLIRAAAADGTGVLLADHYRHHLERAVDRLVLLENGYCREV